MNSTDMSLMMDNSLDPSTMPPDMEVDALFGDVGVGGVDLSFTPRPTSKQLLGRIDEMRRTGCCQYVSHHAQFQKHICSLTVA